MSESTGEQRRIGLVGHCVPDSFVLKNAVRGYVPGAEVVRINDERALEAELSKGLDLLLVNRVLDGRFGSDSGVEVMRALAATGQVPAWMLISNYEDAQQQARVAGARPGFGKADVYSDAARANVVAAMEARV